MSEKKDEVLPKTGKGVVLHQYGSASSMKVEDVQVVPPGEGEVVIRIKAAGLNPADCKIRSGAWNYPIKFPAVLGWDLSGVIVARGYSARRFKVGDEVYAYARRPNVTITGCYAEYITILESYVAHKPTKASFEQAGGIPLAGLTAYQGLKLVNFKENESIAVVGASGGVGSFVVQFAKHVFKAKNVVGIASAKSFDHLKKIGATHTLDYSKDYTAELQKALPGGVDVVFDCFGGDWPTKAEAFVTENARIVSIASWTPPKFTKKGVTFQVLLVEANAPQLEELAKFFDEGKFSVHIDQTFKLEEAGKAHESVEQYHTTGKAVFKID